MAEDSEDLNGYGVWSYFKDELSRGYVIEGGDGSYSERQRRIDTFMQTPRDLEKLLFFGFLICCDEFLFLYTFLPLRLILGFLPVFCCCSRRKCKEPAYLCDVLKSFLLLIGTVAVIQVDTSVIYHMVRGQSILKLYVIFNMLDVFERLLLSFGQDTLDSLYGLTVSRFCQNKISGKRKGKTLTLLFYFVVAIIYIFLHCLIGLFQAATLNVAINSHNKALLTIMISNQFVELKGSVFKKFTVDNLYQISCSDIRERFGNVILIFIVSVRNLAQFNWNTAHLYELLPDIVLIFGSEVLVDWIKHAFLLKFNNIKPEVFRRYLNILFEDIVANRRSKIGSNLVSTKIGFIPLPLACLVLQTLHHNVKFDTTFSWIILLFVFILLLILKTIIGLTLLWTSKRMVAANEKRSLPENSLNVTPSPESNPLNRRTAGSFPIK